MAHSPEETKRNFLAKKGLTEDEIQAAFKQVGTVSLQEPSAPVQPVLHQQQELLLQQRLLQQQSGFGSRVKDLLNVLLLIGGFSYGVRYLWKVRHLTVIDHSNTNTIYTELRPAMAVWNN